MKETMKDKKNGIVSFDMDMTLLDHADYKIPESAKKAVELLREHYYIVVATGRDLDSPFSAGLKEMVEPDAVIHLNGTKITVGDKQIYEHLMDHALVERMLRFAEGKEFSIGMSSGTEDYYVNPKFVEHHDIKRWGVTERNFQDPWKLLEIPVKTLTYIGGEAGCHEVEVAFPEVKLPMFSSREGADIVEKQSSKAEGLKRLCAYYDIPIENTVAFGDSMNDYEIIQTAGIGVAMGNAIEILKQNADYVTDEIGKDGVWNACVKLNLIQP